MNYNNWGIRDMSYIMEKKGCIIMFRPIRKVKNEISVEEAKELLKSERRGVLSVNGDDGYPYAIPINFYFNEEENKIFFHGARAGHKVDSLKKDDKVCFTVYGNEQIKKQEWAPFMQSAVVFGRCHMIADRDEVLKRVREFAIKYYPNMDLVNEELKDSGNAVRMFEITIEHISGKQIQEI